MSSRHKLREMGMSALYQSFLLHKDIKQCVFDICETNEIDPFLYTVTIDAMQYKDTYIDQINHALRDDWEFSRLGYVEQAILIMAACELDLNVSPKQIVVDEAIILAKKYCDEETYKLINGVLDHL